MIIMMRKGYIFVIPHKIIWGMNSLSIVFKLILDLAEKWSKGRIRCWPSTKEVQEYATCLWMLLVTCSIICKNKTTWLSIQIPFQHHTLLQSDMDMFLKLLAQCMDTITITSYILLLLFFSLFNNVSESLG